MRQNLLYSLGCFLLLTGGQLKTMAQQTVKGPSSSQTPYVAPVIPGARTVSILSVTDDIDGYKMVGIPDGLGAFDNGDGTFTLLMNHELGNTSGDTRAHGAKGAFVSSWIIRKSDLTVLNGSDLITAVYGWNAATQANNATFGTFAFNRFCSADLPAISAFYNTKTGLGTAARIFMHGEEGGATGYQLATVASGADKGKSYVLGKFNLSTNGSGLTGLGAWENALANPYEQDKTIVIGNNDGGTGIMNNSVSVYIGTKTNTGSEADKAGLTNGTLKFINVTGNPVEIVNSTTRATNITSGTRFTLNSTAATTFSRPEDGAWNPANPAEYFFVTTDRLDQVNDGIGTQIGRSRLWRLTFDDITKPELGGKIDILLDGTEGQVMMDNLTVDKTGSYLMLLEDVGNAAHNGKIWKYTIATDELKEIAKHDASRFGDIGIPATSPFNQDEETSGIIDVQDILGNGWFLFVDQAHYSTGIPAFAVEGGQLLALYNPGCVTANAAITVTPSPVVNGQQANTIYLGYGPQSVNLTASVQAGDAPYTYTWGPTGETASTITVSPTETTKYTVEIKNALNCTYAANQTITVKDIRDGNKPKIFICHKGKNTLSIGVEDVQNHLLHGDRLGSCENETQKRMIANQFAGEIYTNIKVAVYPNPVQTNAMVSLTLGTETLVTVTVSDAQGRPVMKGIQKNLPSGNQIITFNTSGFANGLYFVEVSYAGSKSVHKMMIRH